MLLRKLTQFFPKSYVNSLQSSTCPCKRNTVYIPKKRFYSILTHTQNHHAPLLVTKTTSRSYSEQTFDFINPIMYNEVLQYLDLIPGSTIVDATFGSGGHSSKILQTVPDVKIFALDRDPVAHEYAQKLSEEYPGQVIPLLGRFSDLPQLMKEQKILAHSLDAFLFDFGCSSMQLKDDNRGFSLTRTGLLDMRMDGLRNPEEPTAADVLERANEQDLIRILKIYGNEKRATDIARAIIETRYSFKRLETTSDLMQLVESIVGAFAVNNLDQYSHTAAKTFQALRIFVNNELNEINYGVIVAQTYLKEKGTLVTIAYNKLEDIIVKQHLTGRINDNIDSKLSLKYSNYDKCFDYSDLNKLTTIPWTMISKHVITPTEDELEMNPQSRRAKMRVLAKCKK